MIIILLLVIRIPLKIMHIGSIVFGFSGNGAFRIGKLDKRITITSDHFGRFFKSPVVKADSCPPQYLYEMITEPSSMKSSPCRT